MKVVCFQPDIRAYRNDLFRALNEEIGGGLVVVHFGRQELKCDGFTAVRLDRKTTSILGRLIQFRQYFKCSDACIVVFDIHYWDVILAVLLLGGGTKKIFWGHGLGRRWLGRVLRTFIARLSDGVIVYGSEGKHKLLEAGIPESRVFVAQNTMWIGNHQDTSRLNKEYFLFVGRIQKRKGLAQLIEAYAMYVDKLGGQALGLKIVGNGMDQDLQVALTQCLDRGLDVQIVPGVVEESVLFEIYSKAIAYVSPGHVGLGVLHAFSYGVPVVTFDIKGHAPEFENLVHEKNGLAVNPDVQSLAKALERLSMNRVEALEMGAAAYQVYLSNASPQAMLSGFKQALGVTRD